MMRLVRIAAFTALAVVIVIGGSAALIAFNTTSAASEVLVGSIVPMHPRKSPARVLIETKQPAR